MKLGRLSIQLKRLFPTCRKEKKKKQEGDAAVGRDSHSVAKTVYRVVG